MEITTGTVIVSAAGGILLKEVVTYLWKKFIRVADGNYVTEKNCTACRAEQSAADREFKKEVREALGQIKGILLVLASGEKVSLADLQKLMMGG